MTYGEKAVGLGSNPSGDSQVGKIKRLYADIIDICDELGSEAVDEESKRLFTIAIRNAQTAQMWAVKAITWES